MAVVFKDAEIFPAHDVEVDVVREFVSDFVIDAPQLGATCASIGSGEVEQGGFVLFGKLGGGDDCVAKQGYLEFGRHIADIVADFHGGGRLRLGCCRWRLRWLRRLRGGLLYRDGLGHCSGLRGWRDGGLRGGIGGRRSGLCLGLLHRDGLGRGGGLRGLRCRGLRGGIGGCRGLCLGLLYRDGLGRSGGLRGRRGNGLRGGIGCGRSSGLLQRDGWLRRGRGGGLRRLRLLNDGRRLYRLLRLRLRGRGLGRLLQSGLGDLRGGGGAACGKRAEQGGYRKRGYEGVP